MTPEDIAGFLLIGFFACALTALVVALRTESAVGKRFCDETKNHDWKTYCRRCGKEQLGYDVPSEPAGRREGE